MRTLPFLFIILPFIGMAQVTDDFSDGNFTENPSWSGTDSCFFVNNSFQLQSTATVAGTAYLSLTVASSDEMEWRFWLRENFSPSSNNYAEVWLSADQPDLRQASQGYFLRFGAKGSDDAIELYRKDPLGESLICKGTEAAIASAFKVAVKVHRDRDGHWSLQTDDENQGVYATEAEGFDDTYPTQDCFGFLIHYTASNAKKFYFDDVYVGPKIVDTDPPSLLHLEAVSSRQLLLTFDEALAETALHPQHYHVHHESDDAIMPDQVTFEGNPSKVLLTFTSPMPENTNLTLEVTELGDVEGNLLTEVSWAFCIFKAAASDVVINEIMADPSPTIGLPEWEYIELFNTTELRIDLKDWNLTIGSSTKVFPSVAIEPLGFLILCKEEAEEELLPWGPVQGFSSFSIANGGATIQLSSSEGTVISEVAFSDTWYHDAEKKNGGWSLEQIDPFHPCAGAMNWSASVDATGGTPGRLNSIDAPNVMPPQVDRVNVLGDHIVFLWFDQLMDRSSLQDPEHYRIEELDLLPLEVTVNPVTTTSVQLSFDAIFQEGVLYTLLVDAVESCSSQPIQPHTEVRFGIPNAVAAGEILLNEVLFDPISPGVDYVELYNYSDKVFDLSELWLGVIKESFPNPADTTLKAIAEDPFLFLPHTYMLLSTNAYVVAQQYQCEIPNALDMSSFPSYTNSGGTALLINKEGLVVDQMSFSEKMHYPLLKETKGVSLERVSWEAPSGQSDNWHSAAEAVGFGTPGRRNSMAQLPVQEAGEVTVAPKAFSPDGDGFDDECVFSYALETAGGTMNTYVFTAEGQLVRHLVRGELVGQEGCFVWNGLDQREQRVPFGLYVVVTEVFNLDGAVKRYRNTVVVASR